MHIDIRRGRGDCDDCGGYAWANMRVLAEGGQVVFSGGWNDHLGGNMPDPEHDLGGFLSKLLAGLGLDVSVTEEVEE
ncbi:hypothetical protein [Roseomonas sp. WA12]